MDPPETPAGTPEEGALAILDGALAHSLQTTTAAAVVAEGMAPTPGFTGMEDLDLSPAAPAVEAGSPEPAQAPMAPVPLTGKETPEELEQLGISGQRAHDRIAEMGRNNATISEENAALKLRLDALESFTPPVQEPGTPANAEAHIPVEFPHAFPDQGSHEDQETWRIQKANWPIMRKHMLQLGTAVATVLGPIVGQHAQGERDGDWSAVDADMKAMSTNRKELEPIIARVLNADPSRDFASTFWAVSSKLGYTTRMREGAGKGRAPAVPAVTTPGSGRVPTAPARQAPAGTDVVGDAIAAGARGASGEADRLIASILPFAIGKAPGAATA